MNNNSLTLISVLPRHGWYVRFVLLFFAIGTPCLLWAQAREVRRTQTLSLQDVIAIAQQSSPIGKQAANTYRTRYWSYRTYQSNYLPQLSAEATFPDFNRSIDAIPQPDGSIEYLERSVANWSGGLSLRQNVTPLGGSIFLNSNLNRFDNFRSGETQFQTNPFVLGYQQPLLQFNALKWDKKIEPMLYTEAQRQYHEDMEALAVNVCNLYFDLLLAQVNAEIARKNQLSNDTLYKIAQGRYNLGKIAENELLQLELGFMNSRQQVIRSELEVKTATLRLKNVLGISTSDFINAVPPAMTPELIIPEEEALSEARKNRSRTVGFVRQMLEAERQVAQSVGETGLQGTINASFGLVQTNNNFIRSYQNPVDQERLNITFSMPILDWGRTVSRRRTAESNRDLVKSQITQQEQTFDQEVFLTVKQYEMAHQQVKISLRANDIGQKRFDIARERYLIGKISITDLNIAFQEKDEARQGYINSLRAAWTNYLELRRATLYDFARKEIIVHELPN